MVWVLVGVRGCVAVDVGLGLVTLVSLSVSVKDRLVHKSRGKSHIYYLEHILVYGRLEDLLLSCRRSGSFRTDCLGGFWVRRSLNSTKSKTHGRGLESQFGRGPRPHDRRVVGWSCLCLGYKRSVCFWVPS